MFCEAQKEVNTNLKTLSVLGQKSDKDSCKLILVSRVEEPITIIKELIEQNASYVERIEDFVGAVRAQQDHLNEEINLLGVIE